MIAYGYCHCGCGEKTDISPRTRGARGNVKGQPLFYVNGHNAKTRPFIESAEPFKLDGGYCRLIALTQGQYCIVNATDYDWLMQWKWQAKKHSNGYYAQRSERSKGICIGIPMHRVILGLQHGDPLTGDHKDPLGTLDNRRENLRVATRCENQSNRRTPRSNTLGFKGISRQRDEWRARIYAQGQSKELGTFATKEQAFAAYCEAALKYHGDFARTA